MKRATGTAGGWAARLAGGATAAALSASPAFAHASDRGFVLLLPTGHYIVGGALAVVASFAVLVAVPGGALSRWARLELALPRIPLPPRAAVSLLSFAVLAVLVAAGLWGSRDPLSNPLPLTIWTLFWIGLTLATGVLGNLFAWVNPWYGPWRLVGAAIAPLNRISNRRALPPPLTPPHKGEGDFAVAPGAKSSLRTSKQQALPPPLTPPRKGEGDVAVASGATSEALRLSNQQALPPPLTPPHKGEGDFAVAPGAKSEASRIGEMAPPTFPSPLWGGVRGGGAFDMESSGFNDKHRWTASLLVRLGYAPAIVQFAAFAWFELVYPAPDDPERLAWAVTAYWGINFIAMLVFGYEPWTRRGECFSVFFRMVSRLSLFELGEDCRLRLRLPGAKLAGAEPLPLGGVLFLLLVLGSVSFDGLMRTFAWLGLAGINPLEFPGRSAVIGVNTAGLMLLPACLAAAFLAAVWLGGRLAGASGTTISAAGFLVWSLAPIALAYHFAHYLIALLVNGQYALAAISDPFSAGLNLFGTADNYISAGLVMGSQSAWVLWNCQAAAIVGGHVLAVLVAHGLAARLYPGGRRLMLSQLPLLLLMVGYTVFGLWLLSTPTGA